MTSAPTPDVPERPRQVSTAGTLTIAGSGAVLAMLVYLTGQLESLEMRELAQDVVDRTRDAGAEVSVDTVITIVRYSLMVGAVLSGTALVLGIFVLRRHRAARAGLTGVGVFAAVASLAFGPVGWVWTAYIAVALALLWTKPARRWFDFGLERPAPIPIVAPQPWAGYGPPPPRGAAPNAMPPPPPGPPGPGWVFLPQTGWVWVPPPPGWVPPPGWSPPPGWVPPPGYVPPPGWAPQAGTSHPTGHPSGDEPAGAAGPDDSPAGQADTDSGAADTGDGRPRT